MRERRRARQDTFPHEGWAVNTIAQFCALEIETPNERHAVWNEIIHPAGQLAKVRITTTQRYNVGVGEIDGERLRFPRTRLQIRRQARVSASLQSRSQHA